VSGRRALPHPLRRAALLALLLAGLGGSSLACGVPDDREPNVISGDEAPLDLDPSDDEAVPAGGPAEVRLYYLDPNEENALAFVARNVEDASLDVAIDTLLSTSADSAPIVGPDDQDLTSFIPPDLERIETSMVGDIATLNFGCEEDAPENCGILALEGQSAVLMFAQLTCTADSVRGVAGVVFQHLGNPQPAPLPGAESTLEPVRCGSF
jgi:hypothetical protein